MFTLVVFYVSTAVKDNVKANLILHKMGVHSRINAQT